MGLQKRGRTKGKSGWVNYSWSKRNGFGTSFSTKLSKNVTLNWFGKGPNRTTVNLGDGWKWVSTNKSAKPTSTTNNSSVDEDNTAIIAIVTFVILMVWIGGLSTFAGWFGWFFGSIIYTTATAGLAWLYLSDDKEE